MSDGSKVRMITSKYPRHSQLSERLHNAIVEGVESWKRSRESSPLNHNPTPDSTHQKTSLNKVLSPIDRREIIIQDT